jgi:hypothetical protein
VATRRPAVESDAAEIAKLVTKHEKAFDDEAGTTSVDMAGQLIKGLIDPTESFVWEEEDGTMSGTSNAWTNSSKTTSDL